MATVDKQTPFETMSLVMHRAHSDENVAMSIAAFSTDCDILSDHEMPHEQALDSWLNNINLLLGQ